ncbi:MAG UNVERIFIED_CONTAM: hypothetical protein LVQ98_07590 [Rickettsiaceae bacterium]|jgi:hypothetical protein
MQELQNILKVFGAGALIAVQAFAILPNNSGSFNIPSNASCFSSGVNASFFDISLPIIE